MANGYGIYYHANGAKYEGEWKDDFQHGFGIEIWTDDSIFEGYFQFGQKNGPGEYRWNDGSKYNGEWKNNKIDG
jgi:hypothetical protein